jgi:pimeloyl-ACP methyl ester carboxylesterase
VDLQGHGRTADIDRPMRYELMGDDIAALLAHLEIAQADVMGYSLGGGVALRVAIQHSERVRRLVLVSAPYAIDGWYPEIIAAVGQIALRASFANSGAAAEMFRGSPVHDAYEAVAPHPEQFPRLLDKMGDLERQHYDWSAEVAALRVPTLLVYGDADSVPPAHAAAFFGLLGGGKEDVGWDRAKMPASRLAILPSTTHYDIFASPLLAAVLTPFLDAPMQPAATAGVPG